MFRGLKPYPEAQEIGSSAHWDVRRLAAIGQLFKANGGSKEDDADGGVPCVRYGDLYTRFDTMIQRVERFIRPDRADAYTRLRYGDVLFAASGETIEDIGRSAVNLISDEVRASGDLIICRPSINVDPTFLAFAVGAPTAKLQKARGATGTMIFHVSAGSIKNLRVPIPPLSDQGAIVRYLAHANARLDRAIAAKRRLIALLEEQKQVVISKAVTRGLDPTAPMKDTGLPWLGEVPRSWSVLRLRHLIEGRLAYGANEAATFSDPSCPRYIRITDFGPDGRLRPETFRSLPWDRAASYMVEPGDILFARSGATVGKSFLVSEGTGPACHAGYLIRARPRAGLVSSRFLYLYTKSGAFDRWKSHSFSRATIHNIGADKYANLRVPLPTLGEQARIVAHLTLETATADTAIARARREIELLREFRTRLAADVVTGQVDVREIAERLPDIDPAETAGAVVDLEDEGDLDAVAEEYLDGVTA